MIFKSKLSSIFLLLSFVVISKADGEENSKSIIIIGAGAAGIAAASKLFENGFKNVKILEAENRIGGRIFTTKFKDYLVDLGAQWIHGENENVAFELAWPLGIVERGNMGKRQDKIFDSNGEMIDQTVANDLYKFKEESDEKFINYIKQNRNASTGEFLTNLFEKYSETHLKLKENQKGILNYLDMVKVSTYSAESWWNVSTSAPIEFHESTGEFFVNWKDRGYSTILDILMKRYPKPEEELPLINNTILNAEVTLIDYSDKNEKVTVKTKNGETFLADHVIVTCSLGVLKDKHDSLFKPSLPEEKQKTIEAIGYGGLAKIFLSFDEPWWPKEDLGVTFSIIWKDNDLETLQNDSEKSWVQGLVKFFSVEHKPRLLAGWVSGKFSREMEKLSEEEVLKHTVEVLKKFLGKSYNITTPTGMMRSMWNTNEHFKGICSYRSVQAETENVFPETLAKPIDESKPILLFAGEATSPHHFSAVHGAIETGWREANRIIKHYADLEKN